jgi:hypothetical protein
LQNVLDLIWILVFMFGIYILIFRNLI